MTSMISFRGWFSLGGKQAELAMIAAVVLAFAFGFWTGLSP